MTAQAPRAAIVAVAMALFAAGCGVADRIDDVQAELEESAEAAESAAESNDGSTDGSDGPGEEGGDLSNDLALGWRLTGPTGTTARVEDVLETEASLAGQSQAYEQSFSFELDETTPEEFLYTAWVVEGDVTFSVDSGGPMQVELVRGYLTQPSEPGVLPEIVFTETVSSAEVAAGESVTLSGTRIDP
ncbi:MAG: hypothetical protein AAF962_19590 [Actinomycetota bacterium]